MELGPVEVIIARGEAVDHVIDGGNRNHVGRPVVLEPLEIVLKPRDGEQIRAEQSRSAIGGKQRSLNEAIETMRGPKGTNIDLTIAREGRNQPFTMTLERDIIQLRTEFEQQ